jgi:hypothetical protein
VSKYPSIGRSFDRLEQVRNRLQHFGLVDQAPGIENLAGEVLVALLVFIKQHLVPGSDPAELEALSYTQELIISEVDRLRALKQARLRRIAETVKERADHIVACPSCSEITLELSEPTECLFCDRTWDDADALAQEYAWSVLSRSWHDVADGGAPPVQVCPECGNETLVRGVEVLDDQDLPKWVCFSCQLILDPDRIDECLRCGVLLITSADSGDVCDDCWAHVIHKE